MNKPATLNKSLLIIKSHVQNLMGAESFLRKRDWRVYSTVNLKEALIYLIKNKPAFVMISTDFPHRKIEELSTILTKIFPVCTIAFAENNTVTSYQFISEMGADYQLYPPVTGPAFERIVNKYLRDNEQRPPVPRPLTPPVNESVLVERIVAQLAEDKPSNSLILKGAQTALDQSVVTLKSPQENVQSIRKSTQVACIMIQSARFSGYLVAAMAKNQTVDAMFIQNVRERLYSFLKSNGEKLSEEDVMNVSIKEVSFLELANEHAEFLKRSVHYAEEVALAFFPCDRIKASFAESYSEEMVAVEMADIKADTVLDFNLYLYLPANKKSLLYTPRGSMLYAKQKEKLVTQGISRMHMLKSELSDFNKYRAQNFLNEKIDEFEGKRRPKAPTL